MPLRQDDTGVYPRIRGNRRDSRTTGLRHYGLRNEKFMDLDYF